MLPELSNMLAWWQWAILAALPPAIVLRLLPQAQAAAAGSPQHLSVAQVDRRPARQFIWQRLRNNLLLYLQLAVLLLIILALLRPSWHSLRLSGRRLVLLIDNSASMQATDVRPNRFEGPNAARWTSFHKEALELMQSRRHDFSIAAPSVTLAEWLKPTVDSFHHVRGTWTRNHGGGLDGPTAETLGFVGNTWSLHCDDDGIWKMSANIAPQLQSLLAPILTESALLLGLSRNVAQPCGPQAAPSLSSDGANLPAVVNALLQSPSKAELFQSLVQRIIPSIHHVSAPIQTSSLVEVRVWGATGAWRSRRPYAPTG